MDMGKISGIYGSVDDLASYNIKAGTINRAEDGFEGRLRAALDGRNKEELKKVCRQFEGIFMDMMYKQMKATVQKSDFIPRSTARDIFESMLDERLMEEAAKRGAAGLGDTLYKQLCQRMSIE